jgi:hypothetical protein
VTVYVFAGRIVPGTGSSFCFGDDQLLMQGLSGLALIGLNAHSAEVATRFPVLIIV